ncbi:MAG: DNA mismatch repair protein MutS [Phototrophicales bacterium]|nr:MAG: DNA mismatch repair protein MutS [Phototrophicales bacterium]
MPTPKKTTPARKQYLDIKAQYPNAIVLFRMGDFYETFDDDAELVARELDLTLTSRPLNKHEKIPMAGVPHHAVEGYIARLVEKGFHVAVVDQIGNEPINGVVPREVTQVITPGTVVEPSMLPERQNNYLLSIIPELDYDGVNWSKVGIAYADITTGEFAATEIHGEETPLAVLEELARLSPREVIMPKDWGERGVSMPEGVHLTILPNFQFDMSGARTALLHHFNVATLEGFGLHKAPLALRAAGAIIQYLQSTQPNALKHLSTIRTYSTDGFMALDATTRASLEIARSMRTGSAKGSLLDIIDRTTTSMGARLLRAWLNQPLLDIDRLNARLDAVEIFYQSGTLRAEVEAALKQVSDLERLVNRIIMDKAGPRDLITLANTLALIPELRRLIVGLAPLKSLAERLHPLPEVIEMIERCLEPEPPALMNQVGVIRDGFNAELDKIRADVSEAREYINNLEAVERKRTGISSLKVGYNKVFGYYIEVTHANADRVPPEYIRKQTLVNAERYITPEMKDCEAKIVSADTLALEVEQRIFQELIEFVKQHGQTMLTIARAIAHIDVFKSLAEVAARNNYTRPLLVLDDVLDIQEGRHPVVEHSLKQGQFVPNDTYFDKEERILLITGPNMAGKSVYMRQVALIVLLAQIGSFVPASQAKIGLVDRIFARVGAQDEIHRGQSTFMVEMTETAAILNHATPRSLVLLDEIGRGTSTYDGMAIARAVIEYLHNSPRLGCKTLFATHYHELTELENILPHVRNYNVAVANDGEEIIFLHRLVHGGASQSYGIHVARLAGVPKSVVNRAREILRELEEQGSHFGIQKHESNNQISLFDDRRHPVLEALRKVDVESISPIDAITLLYELKRLLSENN